MGRSGLPGAGLTRWGGTCVQVSMEWKPVPVSGATCQCTSASLSAVACQLHFDSKQKADVVCCSHMD